MATGKLSRHSWRHLPPLAQALVVMAILAALLAWGSGCSSSHWTKGPSDLEKEAFFNTVRPASGETARLLRNAHYYRLMGRPELALKELEEAHQLAPDDLKLVDILARCYEESGEFSPAQKLYREALARGHNAALHNNLCFSYYQAGRWQEAEACFREALALDPGNAAARNNLGLLYCRLGRQEEARRLWQNAEGPAAAEQNMNLALTALGMPAPPAYAQAPGPRPQQTVAKSSAQTKPGPRSEVRAFSNPGEKLEALKKIQAQNPVNAESSRRAAGASGQSAAAAKKPEATIPEQVKDAGAVKSGAASRTQAVVRPRPLTAEELTGTAIEVRNGTRTRNLAHRTRSALSQEGFNVTRIGNHIDFGAETTTIYYRPGAERVARSLGRGFFSTARMAPNTKLSGGVDVKIILGSDLLERHDLMARLADEGTER